MFRLTTKRISCKSFLKAGSFRAFSTFPSPTTTKYAEDVLKYAAPNYEPVPVVFSSAKGCEVTDIDGKQYLDFLAAYSAVNQGHCHPKIVKAMVDQASVLTLSSRAFLHDKFKDFCKVLTETFNYEKALPMNTGVDAGETAVKVAKRWGYRSKKITSNEAIMVFAKDNFWGRTMAAISSSTDFSAYDDFGPFLPGVEIVEYDNLKALRAMFEEKGQRIAGFMVEPVQGEAGVRVPSPGYLKGVRDLCDEFNVLFIADEVQTGLGRTGKMLAVEHEGVRPDIVILGKALSGGVYPVSTILADQSVMQYLTPGSHGSTYGGNSMACAVGMAALEVIKEENLCERSLKLGEVFRREVSPLVDEIDRVKEVRGIGLMNAMVISGDNTAWELSLKLCENGLLTKPTRGDTIRFTPPLIISEKQLDQGIEIIKRCTRELFA